MTRQLKPEPITRMLAGRLREAATSVIGKSLVDVRYRFLAGASWPDGYAHSHFDEVDMAVALDFEGGMTLLCSWAMEGFEEGVDLESGPEDTLRSPEARESEFRVAETGQWSGLRGDVLSGVGAAWQLRSQLAPETVWAVKLSFASGRTVMIALGEVRNGRIHYQPDNLTVFFNPNEAEHYREEYESQAGGTLSQWEPVIV